jgi:hypothetical protein
MGMEITTLVVTLTGHSAWITPSGVAHLGVDTAQVSEKLGSELAPGRPNGPGRLGRLQDTSCMSCGDLLRPPNETRENDAPAYRRPGSVFSQVSGGGGGI